jgi:hypothetical protein
MFGKGLWMFGPEFESAEFQANRTIATVIRELLGGEPTNHPEIRPDVVALPDSYVLPFSLDGYENNSEVGRIEKLLTIELKKGHSEIEQEDMNQVKRYVRELRKKKHIAASTVVTAYVLGFHVNEDVLEEHLGEPNNLTDHILPRVYDDVVRRAKARMFKLHEKISSFNVLPPPDGDIDNVTRNTTKSAFA